MIFPAGFPQPRLAEVEGAEVAGSVRAQFSPAHAAPFETITDDSFAGTLDWFRTDLPTVGDVARIPEKPLYLLIAEIETSKKDWPRVRNKASKAVPLNSN